MASWRCRGDAVPGFGEAEAEAVPGAGRGCQEAGACGAAARGLELPELVRW